MKRIDYKCENYKLLRQQMKFSSHEDIEAPAQAVFATLSEHEQFQRVMQQRGVAMRRLDDRPEVGLGMAWEIDFKFRGRSRKLRCLVTEVLVPEHLCLSNESDGLTGDVAISVFNLGTTPLPSVGFS